jgi:signal transduction histidine kinase/ligand-binding sensor domain-containing protein
MNQINPSFLKQALLLVFLILIIASCRQNTEVPFPENASEYRIPVTQPFKFPEAKPIKWKEIPTDSFPKGKEIPFDVDKLPFQPFSVNEFKPLKAPISETPLNWDGVQEIKINLDTVTGKKVKVTRFLLPKPSITRLIPPSKLEGTTSGILKLGQAEGLVGNRIWSIETDRTGAVWISTERGLSKYTGDTFENYTFMEKDPTGALEALWDLELDQNGNLLISTAISGLYRLNIQSGILEKFETGVSFFRIQEDRNGLIWGAGANDGVFFFHPDSSTLSQFIIPVEEIIGKATYGIFEDSSQNIWMGFDSRIAILNPERKSLILIGKEAGYDVTIPYGFTEDSKGAVWISAISPGSFAISLTEKKLFSLGVEQGFHGTSRATMFDLLGRLWIVDNDTVFIYNSANSHLKKIPTGKKFRTPAYGLPSYAMVDPKGNMWIGTLTDGIIIADPKGMLSEHFNISNGLASNDVWGIIEDESNRIWLSTYQGLNIYDPDKGRLYLSKIPPEIGTNNLRQISKLDNETLLSGGVGGFSVINLRNKTLTSYKSNSSTSRGFRGSLKDNLGNIWIGTDSGIFKFNFSNNTLSHLDQFSGLASNLVYVLLKDFEGKIWVGTDTGVNVIDPEKNTISYLGKNNGLTSDFLAMILETSKNEILIGTDKGVSIIDQAKSTITHLTAKEGLIPETLYDLNEVNGRIHVGSENGIIVVDRPETSDSSKLWRFTNFGKKEGFPYNDYNQSTAITTRNGTAWWGSAPVMTVNIQDPFIDSLAPKAHITGFNIMDQNPSFANMDYLNGFLTIDDTLWNRDKTLFYTKDNFPEDSGYLAQNKITWDSLTSDFNMPIGLRLPYNQNSFNVSFANLDILGRDKIVYRYHLEGVEKEWSEKTLNSVSKNYYNIPPGDYTFKVATRGFNGVWSEPATFAFVILPPWWQTWWAYLLFSIILGTSVYTIVQIRSQWLKKENKILEERVTHRTAQLNKTIDELKTTQAQLIQSEKMASLGELTAGIAHEIQNPLNFVNNFSEVSNELIQEIQEERAKSKEERDDQLESEILEDIRQNLEKITIHGKRADSIVKGMLQHSRSSSGQKEPTDINILADEYLRLAYHGLRAKDKSFNADFKTNFAPDLPKVPVMGQDLGRVFLNLINNAFYAVTDKKKTISQAEGGETYSPTVTVTTSTYTSPSGAQGGVQIVISDNGGGIPENIKSKIFQPFFTTKPTGKGTGLGLSLSYDIVRAHGGELKVKSEEGIGTDFIISLPLNSA